MKLKYIVIIVIGLIFSCIVTFSIIDLKKVSNTEPVIEKIYVPIDDEQILTNPKLQEEVVTVNLEKPFEPIFSMLPIDDVLFESMQGKSYVENEFVKREHLKFINVTYYDFDGQRQYGELIAHEKIAKDLLEIFEILYDAKYPIYSIDLIDTYNGDDEASMAANNSHAFNFRTIAGSNYLSNHAYGLAIDINPLNNPYIKNNFITPEGSDTFLDRSNYQQGMILKDDICYEAFVSRGWQWGGDWVSLKDYQHFEIVITGVNK